VWIETKDQEEWKIAYRQIKEVFSEGWLPEWKREETFNLLRKLRGFKSLTILKWGL
jgi:hypothetical protein